MIIRLMEKGATLT
jgi:hypothetical protein